MEHLQTAAEDDRQKSDLFLYLTFSQLNLIFQIFDLSNHLDFLTYRLIGWLFVVLQTINR